MRKLEVCVWCAVMMAVVFTLTAGPGFASSLADKVDREIQRLEHGSDRDQARAAKRLSELNDCDSDCSGAKERATAALRSVADCDSRRSEAARKGLNRDARRHPHSATGQRVRAVWQR